ncbi:MFS transporter [Cellulomonas fimi]|uniref:MFS transporter n=1 Tax=Cellulomonas fimi TaxID=1708 RepID=UPI00234C6547|nr:MFS transporter [Cellulomonas fimi]MDC7120848.1 MFS transporter [Cellulomonas fimi]
MSATVTTPASRSAGPSVAPAKERRRAGLGLLVSAQFVVMLDTSIVNVALPSIQADLALTPAGVSWVVNAYVLAFGGLLLLAGRAADVLGRRRMFVTGSAVFTTGTVLAASATGEVVLVGARIVQGAGAAALSTAAMSLLLVMFPGASRARAMSVWGAASTAGGATGVLAGGLVSGTLGWSWVFYATVPVSVVGVLAARRLLDGARAELRRRFDAAGAATITGAVLVLVHTALRVPEDGLSPVVIGFAAAAVALLALFAAIEHRTADPLVPLEALASRAASSGVVLALLGGAARASTFVLVALYLQQGLQLAPQAAGVAMVPTSLAGFVVSLGVLPKVLRAIGPERSMVVGLVVLAAGQLWLARTPVEARYVADVLPALLLVATGVALSFTPTTMVVAAALPEARAGLASGLSSSATQVGAALGMALFTAVAVAAGGGTEPVGVLSLDGFGAAFAVAAVVSLTAAAVALTRRTGARGPGSVR